MSIEAAVTAMGMAIALLGIHLVRCASRDAVHDVEPDPERVRHFVRSAPLERLKAPPPPERGGEASLIDDSVAR